MLKQNARSTNLLQHWTKVLNALATLWGADLKGGKEGGWTLSQFTSTPLPSLIARYIISEQILHLSRPCGLSELLGNPPPSPLAPRLNAQYFNLEFIISGPLFYDFKLYLPGWVVGVGQCHTNIKASQFSTILELNLAISYLSRNVFSWLHLSFLLSQL